MSPKKQGRDNAVQRDADREPDQQGEGKSSGKAIDATHAPKAARDQSEEAEHEKGQAESHFERSARNPNVWMTFLTGILTVIAVFSLYLSRDTERRSLRAYLFTTPGKLDVSPTEGFNVDVRIQNGGQTPALDVTVCAQMDVLPHPLRHDIEPLSDGCFGDGPFLYKDMEIHSILRPIHSAPKDLSAILAESGKRIYVWGNISYRDVFDESHTLRFCYQFGGPSATALVATLCGQHNQYDKQ